MKKTIRGIFKKIADYLRAAVAEELQVMDAFYAQFEVK